MSPTDAPTPQRRCWAEIDLAALERNLGRIRAALPPSIHYVAVVKADAYGHGLQPTATRLMQSGAELYAVANVEEARQLREIGSGWPILVLGALLPEEDKALLAFDLIATVSSAGEAERLDALGRRAGRAIALHLKIDTGMGRLGVWHTEAAALVDRVRGLKHLRLEGIFTHFSSADSDPNYTAIQRRRFLKALRRLRGIPAPGLLIHADNSAGLETFQSDSPVNAVRVGLLQFGILPHPGSLLAQAKVEPVFSVHARIGLVKTLPAGVDISYGRTYRTRRRSRIAVVTAGYGDGIPLALSNRGSVLIRGRRCPVRGRVTMDQTLVDVSAIPEAAVGDTVTWIGAQGEATRTLQAFADEAGTIPYEVLTSFTKRVTRIYKTSRDL